MAHEHRQVEEQDHACEREGGDRRLDRRAPGGQRERRREDDRPDVPGVP